MKSINSKMVIEFTAKVGRNSKVIFNQKLFELEKDLVIKKTNRKNVRNWRFSICYDIIFKDEIIGLFYARPSGWISLKEDVNCMFQFYKNAFDNNKMGITLERLFDIKIGQVEIKTIYHLNTDYENDKLSEFINDHSSGMNPSILDKVKCY